MRIATFLLAAAISLPAAELPNNLMARFAKIIATGQAVYTKDAALTQELTAAGVQVTGSAKIHFAHSEGEVVALKGQGKLVICPKLEWLAKGGSIALVEEGGKPAIYLHMQNIAASGVKLNDAILKIGKQL